MSTRKMNIWVIGLNTSKFTLIAFFLMAGIRGIEKSISAAKKVRDGAEQAARLSNRDKVDVACVEQAASKAAS